MHAVGHDFSRLLQTGLKAAGVPKYLANKVPVINIEGAGWMFESAAILQILCETDAVSHGYLSGAPEERMQFLQWLSFGETIIEHSSSKIITGGIFDNGPESKQLAMAAARSGMEGQAEMIEKGLARHGGNFLLPSGFSACDVQCGYSVINSINRKLLNIEDADRFPHLQEWTKRLLAREGCKRAFKRTKVLKAGR
jgi:glutathione S-transferase